MTLNELITKICLYCVTAVPLFEGKIDQIKSYFAN